MAPFPLRLSLISLCLGQLCAAQTSAPVPTLKAKTKIVVIDVVVTDKQGQPVKNLTAPEFTLAENGTPQTISHFDEHSSLSPEAIAKVEAMPKLAPNIFTNCSPVPIDSTLDVLLLDEQNTKLASKTVVIQQALKYLSTPHPGSRMEIFDIGPEGDLKLIQGFTSDPEILRAALINRKVMPKWSAPIDDPLRACGIVSYSPPPMGRPLQAKTPDRQGPLPQSVWRSY